MRTIYTIGYQKKPLSIFINRLRDAGIDAVIDVRLRNTSHLAGYSKKDTLAFLLPEGFDIAYEHHPELAPSEAIFGDYKAKGGGDWSAYEVQFLPLLVKRGALSIGQSIMDRYRMPCLLCSETAANRCHRRLVAEFWADQITGVNVIHL